jgi:hypothetical protein
MTFHKWIGTDTEEHESCLICGGVWAFSDADRYHHSADGSDAVRCTGDTNQVHGFSGEQWCNVCDLPNRPDLDGNYCPHVYVDCNCLFCDS